MMASNMSLSPTSFAPASDHDDLCFGTRDGQLKVRLRALFLRRVDAKFSVDHAGRTPAVGPFHGISEIERATDAPSIPQNSGLQSCSTLTNHQVDSDVVAQIFRKSGRIWRSITRGENRVFGRTAFALKEGAGNMTDGVKSFFIIDGKRQKIGAFAGIFRRRRAAKHRGVAVADGQEPLASPPSCRFRLRVCVRQARTQKREITEH